MIATGLALYVTAWFVMAIWEVPSKWDETISMIQLLAVGLISAGVVSCAWQRLP
jgi:hypothetical protein